MSIVDWVRFIFNGTVQLLHGKESLPPHEPINFTALQGTKYSNKHFRKLTVRVVVLLT